MTRGSSMLHNRARSFSGDDVVVCGGMVSGAYDASQGSSKGLFLAQVVGNESVCREHWRCVLEVVGLGDALPGQFVQLLCADPSADCWTSPAPLRRPFSIAGLRREGKRCEVDILYRAIGSGTRWLATRRPGDAVSIIGPLGQPFRLLDDRPVAYLVGGGVGLPPLIWLAQWLREAGKETVAFCGARTADRLPLSRDRAGPIPPDKPALAFREFSASATPVVLSTDDGSLGARGQIPDVFARYLERHGDRARPAVVYACGPEPMLQAVARICSRRALPCQVSLERMMACGMGTCQSCVVRLRGATAGDGWRYRLCCTDGPVFDASQVLWEAG